MGRVENNVGIGISAKYYRGTAIDDAVKDADKIGNANKRAAKGMDNNSKAQRRWGRGIFELSRGVEDFGQQISVSFDQAIRASANNFTQFAAVTLGPLAATMVSVGVGLGFMIPPLIKFGKSMMNQGQAAEGFKNRLDVLLDRFARIEEIDKFKDSLKELSSGKQLEKLRDELEKTVDKTAFEIRDLNTRVQTELAENPLRFDLAAGAVIPREDLKQLVKEEEAILREQDDLIGPRRFGSPTGPGLPQRQISGAARRVDELRGQLEDMRAAIGIRRGVQFSEVLEGIEELEENGPADFDLSTIQGEIAKRQQQSAIAQQKMNLLKEQEKEIAKTILAVEREKFRALNQSNAAIARGTQQWQASVAGVQLGLLDESKPGPGVDEINARMDPEQKKLLEGNNVRLDAINNGVSEAVDALEEFGGKNKIKVVQF